MVFAESEAIKRVRVSDIVKCADDIESYECHAKKHHKIQRVFKGKKLVDCGGNVILENHIGV